MKKNGFTLVELITTFALTTVVVVLLINLATVIKNIYSKSNLKTELYINQGNLSNALNSKINNGNLDYYEECSDQTFCYVFNFYSGESIKLTVDEKMIKFGNFVYKLDDEVKVQNPNLELDSTNNILNLKIPIVSDLYPNIDFGINLVYLYNIN